MKKVNLNFLLLSLFIPFPILVYGTVVHSPCYDPIPNLVFLITAPPWTLLFDAENGWLASVFGFAINIALLYLIGKLISKKKMAVQEKRIKNYQFIFPAIYISFLIVFVALALSGVTCRPIY